MDDPLQTAPLNTLPVGLPFRAVLSPHRSLTPGGFVILMLLLGGLSFATGIAFAVIGAWPVLGFFGLDVALVYLAFRLNYRAARAHEIIEVTRDELTIIRIAANGRQAGVTRLRPAWVQLDAREAPDGSVDLLLSSHGRSVAIGRHLSSDERRSFAQAMRAALALVRQPDRR